MRAQEQLQQTDVARIRSYYDESLGDYRRIWFKPDIQALHFGLWDEGVTTHGQSLVAMTREMVSLAGIRPGARILDAGCGVGGPARWLATELGSTVVGVTLSKEQAGLATAAEAGRSGGGRTVFAVEDFTRLAHPSGTYDVVWAQEAACHVPVSSFLREAFRVLRPGGVVVVEDWNRRSRAESARDEQLLREWLACWAIDDLDTIDEWTAAAAAEGFETPEVVDVTARVEPSLRRLHRAGLLSWPWDAYRWRVRRRSDIEHENCRGARLQWRAYRRGLWGVFLFAARKPACSDA